MKIKRPAFGFACLLLACAAVAVQPASAQAAHETSASATTPPASISDVEVTHSGQQTFVRISGGGGIHYQASHVDSPARLVLDFPDTRLAVSQRKVSSDSVPVLSVRLGQPNPGQSRIVVDLVKRVPFTAQTDGSDLVLSFTAPAVEAIPAALHPLQKPVQRKLVAARAPEMPLPA